MAPSVEKKIAELEMGLLHLQQNIDIPEITLPVHPLVAAVIKRYGLQVFTHFNSKNGEGGYFLKYHVFSNITGYYYGSLG